MTAYDPDPLYVEAERVEAGPVRARVQLPRVPWLYVALALSGTIVGYLLGLRVFS